MMRIACRAAAFGIAAAILVESTTGGLSHAVRYKRTAAPQYVWCTGKPVPYDPYDLNQMRASVSASSRLALVVRQREFLGSCHPPPHHARHHTG